jgi:hypothetical protein
MRTPGMVLSAGSKVTSACFLNASWLRIPTAAGVASKGWLEI